MAAMYGTRTAPLAIPPFRRRDSTPLTPSSDDDGLGISPDMLFAMSVEPETALHSHMMSSTRRPAATPMIRAMDKSTRDSLDSFDALFTRNTSHSQNHSPAHTPHRPPPVPRSVSALTTTSTEEPLLYAFPTSSSRRGPLSLPQHHSRARGFGASPSLLHLTSPSPSTTAFNTQSLSNYRSRPRADRELHARARAIVASSSRHTSPPTSSSTSSATSSRSSSPARYELDTSAATSLASSRSPSQSRSRDLDRSRGYEESSPGKPGSQQSSAETVSAMLSEALRNDLRLGRGSPLAPRRNDKVLAWNHSSKVRASVTAPRVSMDVAESYKPRSGEDEGLMRKTPGSPTPAGASGSGPVIGRDGKPMNPLRVLTAYTDRGRRRAT